MRSDVVSLNLPLNDSTRGFFNESCFNKMKDGSVLVKCAIVLLTCCISRS